MELLAWSQDKRVDEVQDRLKLITDQKIVDGKHYIPLELFPTRFKKIIYKEEKVEEDEEYSNGAQGGGKEDEFSIGADKFILHAMKSQR